MVPQLTLKLVSICEGYFTFEEFGELAALFEVELPETYPQTWLPLCRSIATNLEQGNTRIFVDSLLESAEARNMAGIARQTFERRAFHEGMSPVLADARILLVGSATPTELVVDAGKTFSAKSKVRELVAAAQGELFVVDPYIGLGTLDCLRDVTVPIRLLTANHAQAIEADFERALAAFVQEGHQVTVRKTTGLHDRHLVFNDRCWLVGSSLKDAGKKPFHCIEITDKAPVVADLEVRWQTAIPFP